MFVTNRTSQAILIAVSAALTVQFTAIAPYAQGQKPASVPYTWKSVQMVGGGFVDGIVSHPTEKGLRHARTDMGGTYRWNDRSRRWEPLLDWVSYEGLNLMG